MKHIASTISIYLTDLWNLYQCYYKIHNRILLADRLQSWCKMSFGRCQNKWSPKMTSDTSSATYWFMPWRELYFDMNPFCNNLQRLSNSHKMYRIHGFEEDIEDNNDQDAIFQLKYFSNNLPKLFSKMFKNLLWK